MLRQCGGVNLEQPIARVSVENGLQRLRRMAVRHHAGISQDLAGAHADLGNLGDGRSVGRRGVKPQEPRFADHHPGFVKALDRDVVQPGRAVHGGSCHGLGDQYQLIGIKHRIRQIEGKALRRLRHPCRSVTA